MFLHSIHVGAREMCTIHISIFIINRNSGSKCFQYYYYYHHHKLQY